MNANTWGPSIWEDKSQHHDASAVILGTGFSQKKLEANTRHHLELAETYFLAALPAGATILDVGTGPAARFAQVFSQYGFRVTGLDGSATALEMAARATSHLGVNAIRFVEADFSTFDLQEEFNGVFCVETFFHLPGHLALPALSSFNRHLKPNGVAWLQFAVLNEMTPFWLSKQLLYMSAFQLLKPIRKAMKKKSFYVTVTRHTEAEIADLARIAGFTIESKVGELFLFRKTHEPTWTL